MKLKELMDLKNMSQQDLSIKSGVSQGYISALIAEEKSPTLRTMQKLATALGVSVTELITDIPSDHIRRTG